MVFFWLVPKSEEPLPELAKQANMKLTSSAFSNDQFIPTKYTCDGDDVSPPLEIAEVPSKAKSLVLIVDDPDSSSSEAWVHWTVFNIDPAMALIEEDSVSQGALEGKTTFGGQSYGGPCPSLGTHHYHFKLYALDIMLKLEAGAEKKDIEDAIADHVLDWTELIGLYQRDE